MARTLLSLSAVACIILAIVQLLAAQAIDTYAIGSKAADAVKDTASKSLDKITEAAGGLSKNDDIVNDATSKITAAQKDGLSAMDSALSTSKSAVEAAGDDQAAIDAANTDAVTAIETALATAMAIIGEITAAAMSAIQGK
ncbi:hypothetical protein DdX_17313 [Ditylenchus destructor]|uniref:Uncharacterized protein n=1 Tax=Ditylenchus destructor TaxID=166010 RepID=A0AAD4MLW4_9BILA|nr:hypothetical protein DdX_17313 [Ditylenchus destructor]